MEIQNVHKIPNIASIIPMTNTNETIVDKISEEVTL